MRNQILVAAGLLLATCSDSTTGSSRLQHAPVYTSKNGQLHLRVKAVEAESTIDHKPYKKMFVYETTIVGDTGTLTPGDTSTYIAPEWDVQPGDTVTIDYINDLPNFNFNDLATGMSSLPQPINLHTHGVTVSPAGNADNILLSIPPKRSNRFTFKIPMAQHQGLFWYHPHIHGLTDDQVYGGLAGHIVIGRADGNYREFDGLDVHTMLLRYNVVKTGSEGELIDASATNVHGTAHVRDGGDMVYTVNGLVAPEVRLNAGSAAVPAESQIWAFTNVTGSASYILGLEEIDVGRARDSVAVGDPLDFVIVSVDGSPLPAPRILTGEEAKRGYHIPQGGRVAILVQGPRSGDRVVRVMTLQNRSGSGEKSAYDWANQKYIGGYRDYTRDVLLVTYSEPNMVRSHVDVPTTLTTNYTVPVRTVDGPVAHTRTFTFDEVAPPSIDRPNEFPVNGEPFPNNRVDQPKAGTVEEWTLLNESALTHPFHFHTQYGQVTQIVAPINPSYDPNFTPAASTTKVPYATLQYITSMEFLGTTMFTQDVVGMPPAEVGADGMPILGPNGHPTNPGKVVMRLKFLDYLGTYVEHCHRLPHEDRGMMSLVRTIPNDPVLAVAKKAATSTVEVVRSSDHQVAKTITPFPGFGGDLAVAVGDVDGDAIPDVAVASGSGRATGAMVYSGGSMWQSPLFAAELAPSGAPTSGGHVALGDLNGDNRDDVILGEAGGQSRVAIFDGATGARIAEFQPYEATFTGGVRVAAGMVEEGGRISFFTAPGAGRAADVYMYNVDLFGDINGNFADFYTTITPLKVAQISDPNGFTGGVSVATAYPFAPSGGFATILIAQLSGQARLRAYAIAGHSHGSGNGVSASGVHKATAYQPGAPRTPAAIGTGTDLTGMSAGAVIGAYSTTTGAAIFAAPPGGGSVTRWDANPTFDGFVAAGMLSASGHAVSGI